MLHKTLVCSQWHWILAPNVPYNPKTANALVIRPTESSCTKTTAREGSGEGLGEFGAAPGQVQQGFGEKVPERRRFRRRFRTGRLWCRATSSSQQGFGQGSGEGSEEGSGEGLGGFGAEPDQVQQRSREGSREGLGGFGAEPRQVQQGCREGSGEGVGDFGAEPGQVVPEKVPQTVREKVWETLVQSNIRFNRVPEKVPGEGLVQSQLGIKRVLVMLHKARDLA